MSSYIKPSLRDVATRYQLPYSLTADVLSDGIAPPELSEQYDDIVEALRTRPNRKLVNRLEGLVQQYPAVPALKNYLAVAYQETNQPDRVDALLDQTVEQHPTYLVGLINKAHKLLDEQDILSAERLFGGSPDARRLADMYPERSQFHVSEASSLTHLAFVYHLQRDEFDEAENHLRLLRDLGYVETAQLRTMKSTLDKLRMAKGLSKLQEQMKNVVRIDGRFRAANQQRTQPPAFQYPEMAWLYQYGDQKLPADKRTTLLTLPRPSLTADLSVALLDTVYRYEYYGEREFDDTCYFATHALSLAADLGAHECLDAVLETLRQDDEFRDFWWGDFLTEAYQPYFLSILPAQAERLKAFVQEADINTYSKELITNAMREATERHPALGPLAETWFADMLRYTLDHADDTAHHDTDFNGFLIGDIADLQLEALLPLIKTAFDRKLVSESLNGDYAKVENRLLHPDDEAAWVGRIMEQENEWAFLYEEAHKKGVSSGSNILFPPQQGRYEAQAPRVVAPKPGRNDKVSVRYPDGTILRDVKYKKVEADVEKGKCVLL